LEYLVYLVGLSAAFVLVAIAVVVVAVRSVTAKYPALFLLIFFMHLLSPFVFMVYLRLIKYL
jgi:hypothetical protein